GLVGGITSAPVGSRHDLSWLSMRQLVPAGACALSAGAFLSRARPLLRDRFYLLRYGFGRSFPALQFSFQLSVTGLTRSRFQTLFSLRQHGTYHINLYFIFSLAERKNEIQKKIKYCCERSHLAYRRSPVSYQY